MRRSPVRWYSRNRSRSAAADSTVPALTPGRLPAASRTGTSGHATGRPPRRSGRPRARGARRQRDGASASSDRTARDATVDVQAAARPGRSRISSSAPVGGVLDEQRAELVDGDPDVVDVLDAEVEVRGDGRGGDPGDPQVAEVGGDRQPDGREGLGFRGSSERSQVLHGGGRTSGQSDPGPTVAGGTRPTPGSSGRWGPGRT